MITQRSTVTPGSTQAAAMGRRGFLAGMGALAAVPLVGCTQLGVGYSQPSGSIPGEFANRLRIVFWSAFTADNLPILAGLIDRFNRSQTDIYAEVQTFDSYDGVDQKLAAGLQARQIPDLVILSDISWNRYFLNDTLEPLNDYFDDSFGPEAFHDRLMAEGIVDDVIYWTPFARSTPLLYVNPEILAAAGLPERAPKTWDEFRGWGQQLAGVTYRGGTPRMRAFTGGDDWYFQGQVWSFGGGISDGFEIVLDSPESLAAARFDHDLIHVDKSGYLAQSHVNDFTSGMVACIEGSTGTLAKITKASPFPVLAGFLPQQTQIGVPSGGSGLAIMKYAEPERKQAAFELIKFLAAEEQSSEWTVGTGYMPVTKAAMGSAAISKIVAENPNYAVAVRQLEIATGPDTVRKYVQTAIQKMKTAIQRIYGSPEDPDVIMRGTANDLRRSTDRILKQYPNKISR
ncbi:ABC transporter substrate-binding protein [Microlunatus speluncae]|uniref:ABC transporter substrate-binding protein n=1 Tax=Microlunatus speluncae TaxID=2594267 RepID=UPI0012663349|nr:ABC transporter substrate-binding protein [Microlunatus speluncae]